MRGQIIQNCIIQSVIFVSEHFKLMLWLLLFDIRM